MTNFFQKILKLLILGISVTSSSHGMHVLKTGVFSSSVPSRTMTKSLPFFLKKNGEKDLSSDFEIDKILLAVERKDPAPSTEKTQRAIAQLKAPQGILPQISVANRIMSLIR